MLEFVEKEDAFGTIGGAYYGAKVRVMARTPTLVFFNGLGFNYWTRSARYSGNDIARLFSGRPTIAQYEAVADKIDKLLGEGAGAAIVKAWRQHKTVLVDGGGEKLSLPNAIVRKHALAHYAVHGVDCRADLTGRVKTCLQCGAHLKPSTNHHRLGTKIQPDHPRTIEDCQRLTNQSVIAIHGFGAGDRARIGYVRWFETWDGETLQDPHFCNNACAAKYGRRAAEAQINLGAGVEPTEHPWEPREDVDHYAPEERLLEFQGKRFKV